MRASVSIQLISDSSPRSFARGSGSFSANLSISNLCPARYPLTPTTPTAQRLAPMESSFRRRGDPGTPPWPCLRKELRQPAVLAVFAALGREPYLHPTFTLHDLKQTQSRDPRSAPQLSRCCRRLRADSRRGRPRAPSCGSWMASAPALRCQSGCPAAMSPDRQVASQPADVCPASSPTDKSACKNPLLFRIKQLYSFISNHSMLGHSRGGRTT